MVIEEIYGINATNISLNERFTILQSAGVGTPRWKQSNVSINQSSPRNKKLLEQAARRFEALAKRRALRERLGVPWRRGQLRRFGSESNLTNMFRSSSYNNMNQVGVKDRLWLGSNGNLSRSSSFGNLAQTAWRARRAPRRRGIGRGRIRGMGRGRVARVAQRPARARSVTRGRGSVARGRGSALRGRGRGTRPQVSQRGRGRGRGGILRNNSNNNKKEIPTKEELDEQLEQYMACTKSALDKDLDSYMKNAMEFE
ncbi:hypothetical protein EVAR_56005_1 [Eumeta japonica]|uniref:Chromatin target of PRMT1 protein C-terminal domain-containing protein n=1 Tax=Eumeta variegata TaxID=151549 RepID=A0A4C1YV10_EUMVA|nr:hypothetical protein EVAR_56005_1 [Eumeta japonica]